MAQKGNNEKMHTYQDEGEERMEAQRQDLRLHPPQQHLKIRAFYWLYWRWLYYIKDVDVVEVLKVPDVSKEKIPSNAFSLTTILATGMTDVMMTMTRSEVKAIQAEQAGEQPSR